MNVLSGTLRAATRSEIPSLVTAGPDHDVIFVNSAFATLVDVCAVELEGRSLAALFEREPALRALADATFGAGSSAAGEERTYALGRSSVAALPCFAPLFDEHGCVVGLGVQWFRAERTTALERMKLSSIVERRRRERELLSHDLRGPLQVASLAASMMAGADSDATREFLSMRIVESVFRMEQMVTALLDSDSSTTHAALVTHRPELE